ncbi:unnamed protein product [Echinostoma caproni]|uniref:SCAN box domain-containing protein n=1 Tax=Echinostoma caproni TaxID=27848 RepID=A0A183BCM8_9TREM|nr:unnamed protein product [Echinostoma caproni]
MWEPAKRRYILFSLVEEPMYDQIHQEVPEDVTDETFDIIRSIVVPHRRKKQVRDAFRYRTQRLDETAQRFAAELRKLATSAFSECEPSFKEQSVLHQFADGVRPAAVQNSFVEKPPVSLKEAVDRASSLEEPPAAPKHVSDPGLAKCRWSPRRHPMRRDGQGPSSREQWKKQWNSWSSRNSHSSKGFLHINGECGTFEASPRRRRDRIMGCNTRPRHDHIKDLLANAGTMSDRERSQLRNTISKYQNVFAWTEGISSCQYQLRHKTATNAANGSSTRTGTPENSTAPSKTLLRQEDLWFAGATRRTSVAEINDPITWHAVKTETRVEKAVHSNRRPELHHMPRGQGWRRSE